jgi:two-component system response regulator HydG
VGIEGGNGPTVDGVISSLSPRKPCGHSIVGLGLVTRQGAAQIVAANVDVCVVAATNRPREKVCEDGRFRHDLFFRLKVIEIRVPPLRERSSDVPLLAQQFLNREANHDIREFSAQAMRALRAYNWPGNVRELHNVVKCLVALCDRRMILQENVSFLFSSDAADAGITKARIDLRQIVQKLDESGWSKGEASTRLYKNRFALTRRVKRLFDKFPRLRTEPEFTRLNDDMP